MDHDFCAEEFPDRPWCDPWDPMADRATGCAPPPGCMSHDECDDGDFCNGSERCEDRTCVSGDPVACASSATCADAYCDASSGGCVIVPDDARCPAISGVCHESRCDPGAPGADPMTGCVSVPIICVPDANPCTVDLETCHYMFGCHRLASCGTADGCCPYGCSTSSDSDPDCTGCYTSACDSARFDGCCPEATCDHTNDKDCCQYAGCHDHDACCPDYCTSAEDNDCPATT
jgi:hypothetical protein